MCLRYAFDVLCTYVNRIFGIGQLTRKEEPCGKSEIGKFELETPTSSTWEVFAISQLSNLSVSELTSSGCGDTKSTRIGKD